MTLKSYVVARTIQFPFFVLAALTFIYIVVRCAPGDPIRLLFGMRMGTEYSPEVVEFIRHELGLDQPIYIQYLNWLSRVLRGDLGYSYIFGQSVSEMIIPRLINTLRLQTVSVALSILIGIPTGIISAVRQRSKVDYALMGSAIFFWSIPWFWYGLIMIFVFSLYLGVFPAIGAFPIGKEATLLDYLRHIALPSIVLGTSGSGFLSRLVRSSMLEVLEETYIMMARSKGLSERIVIYKHVFRNAMLPVVTAIGLYIAFMVSGSAVIENIFAYPGVGALLVDAARFRDYPVVMGVSVIVSVSVIITVFLTDIAYAFIDPRIRH